MERPADILPCVIRDFHEDKDTPFVFESWMNGYKETMVRRDARPRVYYRSMRARLNMLLVRGALLKVAVWDDDPDAIIGYACAEGPLLHYAFVKKLYRRQGVARQLLAACGLGAAHQILFTHMTGDAAKILLAHQGLLRYVGTDVPVLLEDAYAGVREEGKATAARGAEQSPAQSP